MKKRFHSLLLLLLFTGYSYAAIESVEFANPQQAALYKKMTDELRCLVCQNQNLADSNAALAKDLRVEVQKMIQQGMDEKQIIDFMTKRYGDFVLYRPPFKPYTLILWLGPFIGFIVALVVLLSIIRKRQNMKPDDLSAADKQKVTSLLTSGSSDTGKKG